MALTPDEEVLQAKILDSGLISNPLLPFSPVPSLNKKLATNNKDSLIKALNEIFLSIDGTQRSVNSILNQFIAIIGDFITDPTLATDLQVVGPNILSALANIRERMNEYYTKDEIDAIMLNGIPSYVSVVTQLPASPTTGTILILKASGSNPNYLYACIDSDGPIWARTAMSI